MNQTEEQGVTTANYRDQEPDEIHFALVKNFLIMKKHTEKMISHQKPTKKDFELHKSTNVAISAYIALLNKLKTDEDSSEINYLSKYQKILEGKMGRKMDAESENN